MLRKALHGCWLALLAGGLAAQPLSIDPAAPTPLDSVRLRYAHVGCTSPDSVAVVELSSFQLEDSPTFRVAY